VLLRASFRDRGHRIRLENEWLQGGLLVHLRLSDISVAGSVVAASELAVTRLSFGMAIFGMFDITPAAAFATAEYEEREED